MNDISKRREMSQANDEMSHIQENPDIEKCEKENVMVGEEFPALTFKTKLLSEYREELNICANPCRGLYIMSVFGNGQNTLPIKVLIDSGADMSLLDIRVLENMPMKFRPVLEKCDKQIKLADGSLQMCAGIVTLPLTVGKVTQNAKFLVGNYSDEAILGMYDIAKLGLRIDFQKMLVAKDDMWIPVVDISCHMVGRKVVIRRSVVVPGRTQVICAAEIEGISGCSNAEVIESPNILVMQGENSLWNDFGVLAAKTLHQEVWHDSIPVLLYNAGDEDVELEQEMVIGTLDEVADICENESESVRNVTEIKQGERSASDLPDHMRDLFDKSCVNLEACYHPKLRQFMIEFADVFSKHDFDIGTTNLVQHTIDTGNASPIKHAPRRLNPKARMAADELVKNLLERGLITPSKSPWSAPIVMCLKKDGSYRLCVDFRGINSCTKKDSYPVP